MKQLIFCVIIFLGISHALAAPQKAVLVTGASSGIGLKVTEHLVNNGFYVYAGARKEADLKRLDGMKNITAVRLDVTIQSDIDAAVKIIEKEGRGLFAVVNNAGVGVFSRMSEMPDDEISWIYEVNVMGPVRMNRAFLPLLKASKGRTLIIGSISGFLTGATGGAYSMSKFAVEAYTESLAADLQDEGVYVGIIEPGGFKSKIREKVAMHNLTGHYSLEQKSIDQKLNDAQQAELQAAKERNEALKEPDEVAAAVIKALTSDKPKLRYMVAPNKAQADMTTRAALSRALQLNADHPYAFTREELVALLDELLAGK